MYIYVYIYIYLYIYIYIMYSFIHLFVYLFLYFMFFFSRTEHIWISWIFRLLWQAELWQFLFCRDVAMVGECRGLIQGLSGGSRDRMDKPAEAHGRCRKWVYSSLVWWGREWDQLESTIFCRISGAMKASRIWLYPQVCDSTLGRAVCQIIFLKKYRWCWSGELGFIYAYPISQQDYSSGLQPKWQALGHPGNIRWSGAEIHYD